MTIGRSARNDLYLGYMVSTGGYVSGKPKSGNSGLCGWKARKIVDHIRRNEQKAVDWPTRRKRIQAAKAARAVSRRAQERKSRKSNRGQ
jgi:hypothetical protein